MNNPLLEDHTLPPFQNIDASHITPAIESIIAENRLALQQQLDAIQHPNWQTLIKPLEDREDRLSQAWSPVGHLNGVMNSPALRDAYNQAIERMTEYSTEMGQNARLFKAYLALAESDEFAQLNTAQQKTVNNALRDFRLAGVDLPESAKRRYAEIQQRLSQLSTQFSNNVLDATQGWYYQVEDKSALAGLPLSALAIAQQTAKQKNLPGYVITLDAPAYIAVMTHADDRDLRQTCYRALSCSLLWEPCEGIGFLDDRYFR